MQTRAGVLGQIEGPEIFIGLVGAVGTNLPLLVETLSEELREVSYEPHEIHLSALIKGIPKFTSLADLDGGPEEVRIGSYMNAGDEIRGDMTSGDALALLSVIAIQDYRQEKCGKTDIPLTRQAYILNSLKVTGAKPRAVKVVRCAV
jgi:hypothetical protein